MVSEEGETLSLKNEPNCRKKSTSIYYVSILDTQTISVIFKNSNVGFTNKCLA